MTAECYTRALDALEYRDEYVTAYPAGRRCAHPGCPTILSVYNPNPVCGLHGGAFLPWSEAEDPTRKRCHVCGQWLDLDQFGRDATRKGGRAAKCRDCKRAHDRANYQNNPEVRARMLERQRVRREKLKRGST